MIWPLLLTAQPTRGLTKNTSSVRELACGAFVGRHRYPAVSCDAPGRAASARTATTMMRESHRLSCLVGIRKPPSEVVRPSNRRAIAYAVPNLAASSGVQRTVPVVVDHCDADARRATAEGLDRSARRPGNVASASPASSADLFAQVVEYVIRRLASRPWLIPWSASNIQ